MASPKKITPAEIQKARKAGVKAKKPRKPKSKTLTSLESYITRYNGWVDKMKDGVKKFNKLESDKKKKEKLKHVIGAL
jgi:hypothetical protein